MMDKLQKEWFDKESKKVWGTGWRRHGAKVGDRVVLQCYYDDYEVEPDDYPDGLWSDDEVIDLRIANGAVGIISQLMDYDCVRVEISCTDIWTMDTYDISLNLNLCHGSSESPRFETYEKKN